MVGARGEEGNRLRNLRPGVGSDGMAKLTVCSACSPLLLQNRTAQPAPKVSSGAPFDSGFARTGSVTNWRNHQLAPFSNLQAVHFEDCQGISVKGITLQNSQQYHLTFTRSSDVEANYLRVTSPEDSIDTKGGISPSRLEKCSRHG